MLQPHAWALYETLEAMAAELPGDAGVWLDVARHRIVRRLNDATMHREPSFRRRLRPWLIVGRELGRPFARREFGPALRRRPLFVVDGGSHGDHARPIAAKLSVPPNVVSLVAGASIQDGFPTLKVVRPENMDGRRLRGRTAADWVAWMSYVPKIHRELMLRLGQAGADRWWAPSIERGLWHALTEDMIEPVLLRRTVERLFRELEPSVLVAFSEEGGSRRLVVALARSMGIPTVCVQHGLYAPHPKFRAPIAGTWCVWGEADRQILISLGHDAERVVVTGPPGFDGHEPVPWIPSRPPRVLITAISGVSQIARPVVERTLGYVLKGASAVSEARVLLKPHPVDVRGLARSMAAKFPRVEIVQPTTPTSHKSPSHHAIDGADVVVAMVSTTAFEAILCRRPLVLADEDGEQSVVPFARRGAALLATSAEELTSAIRSLLHDAATRRELAENQERFLISNARGADGRAAERVAEAVRAAARWEC